MAKGMKKDKELKQPAHPYDQRFGKIELLPLSIVEFDVTIVGITPLIFNKFSEKAKKQIRDKQQKQAAKTREAREPEKEFMAGLYYLDEAGDLDRLGAPVAAIKESVCSAAADYEGVTKAGLRRAVFIKAVYGPDRIPVVPVRGSAVEMREDVVRLAGISRPADLRYRGMMEEWEITFTVQIQYNVVSPQQFVNLLRAAGFGVGLLEWRPEKGGEFGRYDVKVLGEAKPLDEGGVEEARASAGGTPKHTEEAAA